jgi:putative DNA primase/helicase
MHEADNIRAALSFVPAYDRDIWLRMGMAVKSALGDDGYSLWAEWSEQELSWNERDGRAVWRSIRPNGKVTIGTLFYEAKRHGFKFNGEYRPGGSTPEDKAWRKDETGQAEADEAKEEQRRVEATSKAATIWNASQPLAQDHAYLVRKQIKPVSTLREITATKATAILGYTPNSKGEPLIGRLIIVPVKLHDRLSTLELIDEQGRKAALYGGAKAGGYWAAQTLPEGDGQGETLLIGEGVATVLSAKETTGHLSIAALTCGNLERVAKQMRQRYPAATIVILGELGNGQAKAEQAARTTGALLALPEFGDKPPENATDFNDLARLKGPDAVCAAVGNASKPTQDKTNRIRVTRPQALQKAVFLTAEHRLFKPSQSIGCGRTRSHAARCACWPVIRVWENLKLPQA